MDDRRHALAGPAGRLALPALVGESERLLEGGFRDADAFQADGEARIVHHGEHAGEALVLLADEPADRAFLLARNKTIAVDHGAGRRTVDAELVLDRGAEEIVAAAKRAVFVDEEFRHEEERDAARARRRVGQACEDQMHDVVGKIVLAIGDENLLAEDAIGAVRRALGAGAQRAEIRARLRLGEVHRAGPLARNQLCQIGPLEFVRGVFVERFDRAHGERRAERERERGRVPHLKRGDGKHRGQALPAEFLRTRQRIPAAVRPATVKLLPARWGRDRGVLQHSAMLVACLVERCDFLARESPGFSENRVDKVEREIAELAGANRRPQPRNLFQRERDFLDRGAVHVSPSLFRKTSGLPRQRLPPYYVSVKFNGRG